MKKKNEKETNEKERDLVEEAKEEEKIGGRKKKKSPMETNPLTPLYLITQSQNDPFVLLILYVKRKNHKIKLKTLIFFI